MHTHRITYRSARNLPRICYKTTVNRFCSYIIFVVTRKQTEKCRLLNTKYLVVSSRIINVHLVDIKSACYRLRASCIRYTTYTAAADPRHSCSAVTRNLVGSYPPTTALCYYFRFILFFSLSGNNEPRFVLQRYIIAVYCI